MTTAPATTRPAFADHAAAEGRTVQQGHANHCAAHGHATHIVDGIHTGTCARCGEVTGPARDWFCEAPLGARVAFLNADDDRRVEVGTIGVVTWVADGRNFGRNVRLDDGREVNVPCFELTDAPHGDRCTDTVCCPTGTLVVRYHGGTVDAFDLDLVERRTRLRREFEDAAHGQDVEPIVDAWHFDVTGAPVPVTFATVVGPFDGDDYADATVTITRADGRVVTSLGYRIDGRS